mgnify:CR=1 FL=1
MAMNGKKLGDDIAELITASDAPSDAKASIKKLWEDIGNVIVNHITQNAMITVAAGIPVATAGSESAQTGATTATGTATIM